jgi:hypothetical protein
MMVYFLSGLGVESAAFVDPISSGRTILSERSERASSGLSAFVKTEQPIFHSPVWKIGCDLTGAARNVRSLIFDRWRVGPR